VLGNVPRERWHGSAVADMEHGGDGPDIVERRASGRHFNHGATNAPDENMS